MKEKKINSNYAVVHFIETIDISELKDTALSVRFNTSFYVGETNIMTINEYCSLKKEFSCSIIGKIIKQEELYNILNAVYKQLKNEIYNLYEPSIDTIAKLNYIISNMENDGILKDDSCDDNYTILVNEIIELQELIRIDQKNSLKKTQQRIRRK